MNLKIASRVVSIFVTLALLLSLFPLTAAAAPAVPVTFTILHTNDFHGQLEASGSNPGMARVAQVVNTIRGSVGAANVLLVDAGDEMQGSLLSNLGHGLPTVATYNAMGYNVATFGNHEFDWGQENLADRTTQATYPYVTANIVQNDTGNCATAGWTSPTFADAPYEIQEVGTAPNTVKVGFIGVTTTETPTITVSTATAGLCFKDPAESILHYYDEMKTAGADVIVVLSHLGYADGGYGYGIPVYGDQTLASRLNTAGKPANLIIGGHSHSNLAAATVVGTTTIAHAYYNGRTVGRADITVATSGAVSVTWSRTTGFTAGAKDPTIDALVTGFATDPAYQNVVNLPIGYSAVDLPRKGGNADNMMGTFINDAIYNYLNSDGESVNDVDIFFNNAGGIRTDWCYVGGAWVNTGCVDGVHEPGLLTYGNMFTILPFGNQTIVGRMTGAKILEILNYGPNVAGVIQPAGLKYSFFKYVDTNPGPQPYAWGAYDVTVYNKTTMAWEPLDLEKTYNVGTNEFLAPAGGDGYSAFRYMTNITYWGDMLNAVNTYVSGHYGTPDTAYAGTNGDGTLDGRIVRDGTDAGGSIIPLTVLHHNDSHGNLPKTSYVGYTQLASLIKQERLHNPSRTLLLSSGDNIQGDAMSYFFKTAPTGFTSDGTPIADSALHMQPLIKAFNSMGYDAMTLGNHEFNFGKDVFTSVLGQATFPLLQANVSDDGSYGLAAANIEPYVEKDLGDIDVAILGIGNHRIPNYELPSNIPGLTFSDPIAKTQELSTLLRPANDVLIALTHIGFTENPASVEVDANVDTNLIANVSGLDAVVGGHSHTNPASGFGDYKYLPSIIPDADGKPVVVNHAYRYNNTLGELSIGLRSLGGGNYEVVSQTGRYISVVLATTPEDPDTKAIIDPYVALLNNYNNTVIGQTTTPIDALQAFTQETNGANLQADAAVYELSVKNSIPVDFHLSGAMTNRRIADGATPDAPYSLKISDMFAAMPYENSLVVLKMNGPQLKAVLERAYRNYYYYKYVPGYGGYSYYTTCMLDINAGNQIIYNDLNPALPNGNNVVALLIGGVPVDFTDATKYYNVSTVNYLAAGSCNFNDAGATLWPLNQIVADTQYYVRDAVIDYVTFKGIVSPAIEGRLSFIADNTPPAITIVAPTATTYLHPDSIVLDFIATDDVSGVKSTEALLDGEVVANGQTIALYSLALGDHTFTVNAVDKAGNAATQSVTFSITATIDSLKTAVDNFRQDGSIKDKGTYTALMAKLDAASKSTKPETTSAILNAFIKYVQAQSGKHIKPLAANRLIADAQWVIIHLPDTTAPIVKIYSPRAMSYPRPTKVMVDFFAYDAITGVKEVSAMLDETPVVDMQKIDLSTMALGNHTLTVTAIDFAGNTTTQSVTFKVELRLFDLKTSVDQYYRSGDIKGWGLYKDLIAKLTTAYRSNKPADVIAALNAFIAKVQDESGKHITPAAATQLISEAQWIIDNTK
ncbi:MAG: bifunctional metallophosphatase/5'-nucleotidase [Chloroflexi bacterium]|nr:bifunctional metallophosphatase/5'-nucleotidase [Chloroflexota bacterium]